MKWAQIGNFGAPHSTEWEMRKGITAAGHEVVPFQENADGAFRDVAGRLAEFDVVLWTMTGWADPPVPQLDMLQFLAAARTAGVPTVGYHLDIWHGLAREHLLYEHPFFRVALLITADGAHEDEFASVGINHRWLPPGVSEFECVGGTYRPEFDADVAFIGSWQRGPNNEPGYHPEHPHRMQLVDHLQSQWAGRVRFWPEIGQPAVRMEPLRDLYASTKVNVGDSCFAGQLRDYWSDRITETLGRGGFLLHPYVPDIEDWFTDGEHLRYWQAGDWDELDRLITYYLDHDDERRQIAAQGRAHVLAHHTCRHRIEAIVDLLELDGMLRQTAAVE